MSTPDPRDAACGRPVLALVRPDERIAVPVAPDGLVRHADYAAYLEVEAALALVRERAARIEAEARAACEAEKRRGHREGLEAGRAEMFALVTAYRQSLEAAVADQIEELVGLVAACIEQAIGSVPPREFVGGLVEQALLGFDDANRVDLYGHPDTLRELERTIAEAGSGAGAHLRAHADPELSTDEFRLVTGELSVSYARAELLGLIAAALAPTEAPGDASAGEAAHA